MIEAIQRGKKTILRLPRWPMTPSRRSGLVSITIGGLVFAIAGVAILMVGLLLGWSWFVVAPGSVFGVLVGLALLAGGHAVRHGRCSVTIHGPWLEFHDAWSFEKRHLNELSHIVVHPLMDDASGSLTPEARGAGVLEIVRPAKPPIWFGNGYPCELLRDLVARLTSQLQSELNRTLAVQEGPPLPAGKVDDLIHSLHVAPIDEEVVADVKSRPETARWQKTREGREPAFTLPPRFTAVSFQGLTLAFFLGIGGLSLTLFGFASVSWLALTAGPLLLIASASLVLLAIHWATVERRLVVENGKLISASLGRLTGVRRQEWPIERIAALRAGRVYSKGDDLWVLDVTTTDGRVHEACEGYDGEEMRWLATELRAALGVPALRRPE